VTSDFLQHLRRQTEELRTAGLFKAERVITSPQQATITVAGDGGAGRRVLNLCANNYLGLANHPALIAAAKAALDRYGFGMSSVRFICGTQEPHKALEAALSRFLGTEDTILYGSCFDANAGLFETLLDQRDAVISDALNHASIIDGIRLSKARRLRYANNDMDALEARLEEARDCRFRLIATDGVFSMDGIAANLPAICELAARHDALLMVDVSHATGVLGPSGRGTPEHWGVQDRVDLKARRARKGGKHRLFVAGRGVILATKTATSKALPRTRFGPYVSGRPRVRLDASLSLAPGETE